MSGFIKRRPQRHNHSLRRDYVAEVRLGQYGALAVEKAIEAHRNQIGPISGPELAGLLLKMAADAYIAAGADAIRSGQILAFRPPTVEEDSAFWFLVSRARPDGTTVL